MRAQVRKRARRHQDNRTTSMSRGNEFRNREMLAQSRQIVEITTDTTSSA